MGTIASRNWACFDFFFDGFPRGRYLGGQVPFTASRGLWIKLCPGGLGQCKDSVCSAGDLGFYPWVREDPWGRDDNPL